MMDNSTARQFIKDCPVGGSISAFIQVGFPSEKYFINQIIYCIVNALLMIATAFLNGISVLTISRSSQLKSKTCYFLILIQSTGDFAVSVVFYPLYIITRASELVGAGSCVMSYVCEELSFMVIALSYLTLCSLTFERYASILHPIQHRLHLSKKMILRWFCCLLVFILLIGPPFRYYSERIQTIFLNAVMCSLLALNTFAYVKIYLAVTKRGFSSNATGDLSNEERRTSGFGKRRKSSREKNLAKSCALVVAMSYFLYVPTVFSYIYFKYDSVLYRAVFPWCMTIMSLNASMNSIIFFWKRPLLRAEARKMMRNWSRKR